MSDLTHKSADELRKLVSWCEQKRSDHRAEWESKEAEIERLKDEVANHRRLHGNIGQKMVWARIYLAKKTPAYLHEG